MNALRVGSFLPGRLWIELGRARDYGELERFHYLGRRPATWAGVWVIRYRHFPGGTGKLLELASGTQDADPSRIVAVAVLSYPTVNSAARDRALEMNQWSAGRKLPFVNAHVRTISRVIVHPQFRGAGLARELIRHVCDHCPTRWVEAFAVMGRVHPVFARAGMREFWPEDREKPVYYLFERDGMNSEAGVG